MIFETSANLDGDFIVGLTCPICKRYISEVYASFEKDKIIELNCGHKFKMLKLISEIGLEEVE